MNPAQREAVVSTEGPYLVIAGAGSGKTRVLVYRTAYLVSQGVAPESILLLTFTRRAAGEMLRRASEVLDARCQNVSGGTFHSFANLTLRRHAPAVGLPRHFSIMDESDAENAVGLVCSHMGLRKADKRFPKKGTLLSLISKSVNKGVDVGTVIYEEYPHFMEWSGTIGQVKDKYFEYKRGLGLLDFDDLLVYMHELLVFQPQIRKELSERYRYIMVDEYQDTNKIQGHIVQLLAGEHKNLMVVGDDSQSIYSFRGAHFRNIIEFPKVFPEAKVITLEENYRSCQPILDMTNEVILAASERFEKTLFSNKPGRGRPVYADVADEHSQSRYVLRKVLEQRSLGVPLSEMAVLFRSGWHSNDLEVELASHGIPFVKYGGQKFAESAHVKDVLSFLRIVYNASDEMSWTRALLLLDGIGPKTVEDILKDVICGRQGLQAGGAVFKKKPELQKFFDLLRGIDGRQPPADLLKDVLGFYLPILMSQHDDYDKRLSDLESLERIASRYQSLEQFLADMTLDPLEKGLVEAERSQRKDHLIISTIHSAKGLEWHTVFLIYVAEGYLPSYRAFDNEGAIEEERRLFYVAATRAKENLYLIRPQVDGAARGGMEGQGSIYTRMSRFLEEGRILEKFVDVEGGGASRFRRKEYHF